MKVRSRTVVYSNEERIFYRDADARDCTHERCDGLSSREPTKIEEMWWRRRELD
jgi:hypothetical protein